MTDRPRSVHQSLSSGLVGTVLVVTLLATGAAVAAASVHVAAGTVFEASEDGPTVEITEDLELDSPYQYPDGETVDLSPNATFESDGDANVTVDSIDGPWTNLTTHDVSEGLTVRPRDKQNVTIEGGNVSAVGFRAVHVANGRDAYPGGSPADVSYTAGNLTVTVTDLPSNEPITLHDASTGANVSRNTTTANGTAAFALPEAENATVGFAMEAQTEPPAPAPSLSVASTSLSAQVVEPGDRVRVSVTLANDGDAGDTHAVSLQVDGETVETTRVRVGAGEERAITFARTFETAGEYDLSIDGQAVGTVTVDDSPESTGSGDTAPPTATDGSSTQTGATPAETGASTSSGEAKASPAPEGGEGGLTALLAVGVLLAVGGAGLWAWRER